MGINVLLLEAMNRPGGRVKTESKTFGYPVDHGAILVDFKNKGNLFEKYMKQFNTKLVPVDPFDSIGFDREGKEYQNYDRTCEVLFHNFINFFAKLRTPSLSSTNNYLMIYMKSNNLSNRDYNLLKDHLRILTHDLDHVYSKEYLQSELSGYLRFNAKG